MNIIKHTASFTRQKGFTLVELMVALGISLFLVGGAMAIMLNGSQSSRFNDKATALQDSVRLTFHNMEKDIRMAGYWGCGLDITMNSSLGINNPLAAHDPNSPASDRQWLGLEGWNGSRWLPSNTSLVSSSVTILPNTDAITVRHIGGSRDVTLTTAMVNSTNMSLTTNNFQANESMAITNCQKTELFSFGSALSQAYAANTTVSRLRFVRYFLANNGGEPYLYRQMLMNGSVVTQPMFAGIERMLIRYGEDTAPYTGVPDTYVTAANVTDWGKVITVRVGVLARSGLINDQPLDSSNYSLFGTQVLAAPNDRRIRRTFYNTIQIRNSVI